MTYQTPLKENVYILEKIYLYFHLPENYIEGKLENFEKRAVRR